MVSVAPAISRDRYRVPTLPVRRFSVSEYHRLIADGFFARDEQFELIEGFITPKMSRGPRHDATLNRARRAIEWALPSGYVVRIQSAVTLDDSEPEPDIAVARGDDDLYQSRHPGAKELQLVVEIADSSLDYDLNEKRRVYAVAGVCRLAVLDVVQRQVTVLGDPRGGDFRSERKLAADEPLVVTLDDSTSIDVSLSGVFGPLGA